MFNWLFGSVSKLEHKIALEKIAELENRLEKRLEELDNQVFDLETSDRSSLDEGDVERIVENYLDGHLFREVKAVLKDASVSIDL